MQTARQGITLLEIITALLILAFAFIPLIGVIGTSSGDSDVANSVVFAQTAARNILDTLLDDVPFYAITPSAVAVADLDGTNPESDVAVISDIADPAFNKATFLTILGNTAGADDFARGEIVDERNQVYRTKLFVFPIPVNDPVDPANDLSFTYLPRPIYENQVDGSGQNQWYTYPADGTPFMRNTAAIQSPYGVPDGVNVVQPVSRRPGAFELGAPAGPAGNNYCVMKKILLKVSWRNRSGHDRSVDIFTMKANLQ